jgi:hypothetical protein
MYTAAWQDNQQDFPVLDKIQDMTQIMNRPVLHARQDGTLVKAFACDTGIFKNYIVKIDETRKSQ